MSFNPWHDVEIGDGYPTVVNAVIEISKGSKAKYEIDKSTGMLKLDRVLYSSVSYPANYGFIPRTYADDHDPLDILVLSQIDFEPLCIVRAQVIGVIRMTDENEADDKIIAVAADDKSVSHIGDISGLPEHFFAEVRHFFEEYTRLEYQTVRIEEVLDREGAFKIVRKAVEYYSKLNPRH